MNFLFRERIYLAMALFALDGLISRKLSLVSKHIGKNMMFSIVASIPGVMVFVLFLSAI